MRLFFLFFLCINTYAKTKHQNKSASIKFENLLEKVHSISTNEANLYNDPFKEYLVEIMENENTEHLFTTYPYSFTTKRILTQ